MVMEQYLINDTTLSAIGDAIRQVKGEEKYLPTIGYSHTPNIDDEGNVLGSYGDDAIRTEVVTIPGASSLKITITYQMGSTAAYGCICIWEGNHPEYTVLGNHSSSFTGQIYRASNKTVKEYTVQGDSATFGFYTAVGGEYGYYAVVEGEGSNAGAINPDTNYLPSEIPQQITEITTLDTLEVIANGTYTPDEGHYGFDEVIVNIDMGNTIPKEAFVIKDTCDYRFANGGWDWFIKQCGNKITTESISTVRNMFYYTKVEEIPFELNFTNATTGYHGSTQLFYGCDKLKILPKINNFKPDTTKSWFESCKCLREIPADWVDNINWSYITGLTSAYSGDMNSMFKNCYSLRSFPMDLLIYNNPYVTYSYSIYYGGFNYCLSLDEVVNLPVAGDKTYWTSNAFYSTFDNCSRLKRLTFGFDNKPEWKSQTIDLSKYVGYVQNGLYGNYIITYNSGITEDKVVTDDATYQALKDDPDWFTIDIAYSRYNHDSAVETINSLPDTSAYLAEKGGTNTIKFKGASGSKTDGGAINTLTAEEIAVATAKGWTVTLV